MAKRSGNKKATVRMFDTDKDKKQLTIVMDIHETDFVWEDIGFPFCKTLVNLGTLKDGIEAFCQDILGGSEALKKMGVFKRIETETLERILKHISSNPSTANLAYIENQIQQCLSQTDNKYTVADNVNWSDVWGKWCNMNTKDFDAYLHENLMKSQRNG